MFVFPIEHWRQRGYYWRLVLIALFEYFASVEWLELSGDNSVLHVRPDQIGSRRAGELLEAMATVLELN